MTPVKSTITAGAAGTSAMTALSYLVSEDKNKQFREPELLSELLHRLSPKTDDRLTNVAGWLMHYTVGFGFSTAYGVLWQKTKIKPSLLSGLILGGISGVLGIAVWKTVFSLHPKPPKTDFKNYYAHLMVAHIVFATATALTYRKTITRHDNE